MKEKLKKIFKNNFSNSPKAKVLFGLVIIAGLIGTIYSMRKTLTVNIDGEEQTIATYKGTVEGALHDNKIVLSAKDKVHPALDEKIKQNEVINITKAIPVEISVDDKLLKIESAEKDVSTLLASEGIDLEEHDKIMPGKYKSVTRDMKIEIVRVDSEIIKEKQNIDYNTIQKSDDTLQNTVTKTLEEGTPGEKEIAYRVVYENGKEISREKINETVTKEPKDKVVVKGTLETLALSRGENLTYKKRISVMATAYNGHTITASGAVPKRNPGGISTIAVDPSVIPLGTKVYVEGYGYAIAQDTGGLIKSNKIDLFMNSASEANSWGIRRVNLYVIS